MCAADFDDTLEFKGLAPEQPLQIKKRWLEIFEGHENSNTHRSRIQIIDSLPEIDVLLRMYRIVRACLPAQKLIGSIGDDLIYIGVYCVRGTGLEGVDWKLVL